MTKSAPSTDYEDTIFTYKQNKETTLLVTKHIYENVNHGDGFILHLISVAC